MSRTWGTKGTTELSDVQRPTQAMKLQALPGVAKGPVTYWKKLFMDSRASRGYVSSIVLLSKIKNLRLSLTCQLSSESFKNESFWMFLKTPFKSM